MGKSSSHYLSYFTLIVNSKITCFVILILSSEICSKTFGVMSEEFFSQNLTGSISSTNEPDLTSESSTSTIQSKRLLNTTEPSDCSSPIGYNVHCWNTTKENILTCCCGGPALLRIPQMFPIVAQRLNILNAGLKTLRTDGLKRYALTLEDIVFKNLPNFESIEPGAFATLDNLRSIEISHAPQLKYLPANVFEGISPSLKSLRILNCGLVKVPDMRFISTGTILNIVDLEGNRIEVIDRKSVNIRTEQLILDNNALTYIYDSAFFGSEIAKLSLKRNQKLREIHQSAFAGILNVIELDLSSTSIESLPTDGLEKLEFLRIQNTYTLKTIPSVYTFENLKGAWLTHSFHCCAFKFPQRHNPLRHAQRIQYLAELRKRCMKNNFKYENKENSTNRDPKYTSNVSSINDNDINGSLRRSKRLNNYFYNHFEDQTFDETADNRSLEYETFENSDQTLTLSPVVHKGIVASESSTNYNSDNAEDGEFLDTTAEVVPNEVRLASCGALATKKVEVECYPIPNALNPCEDVMGSQWLRSSVWVVVFLAVFGNVAVLLVLFSNWNDVTVPKFLMSHLAFADLCLGLYLLLIAAIDIHSMGEYFNFAYDWQYGIGCKVAGFLTVFASHLSVFTLTVITIERWYAITHAINLNKRIKLTSASIIMICGWVYSILMSSLPLFGISNYSSTSICLPMEAMDLSDVIYLVSIMSANGLAFSIIAICYARIYFSLGKETRKVARNVSRGEMTVAKKMALLVFTNFACWAPIAFFGLTALAGLPLIDVAKSKILLVFFYPLNSCADPYLYAILTAQYRRDLFALLSKYGFFTQKAQQYKMNYSFPTTNHTCPVPLIDRRNSSISGPSVKPKNSENEQLNEEFV